MNNLITIENNNLKLSANALSQILAVEGLKKTLKKQEEELRKTLQEEMEASNIKQVETYTSDDIKVLLTYIEKVDVEKFDMARFKEEYPDLYDQYITMEERKPSIRINIKK